MSRRDSAIEAATEAMSLPGEKGLVRALTRDDAERAVDTVIAEVAKALRGAAANWSSRSGDRSRQHGNSHRGYEDERATRLYFAADFIEREFTTATDKKQGSG